MIQRIRTKARSERGQALIEFALLFPFLMMFLFVLLDFGIAIDRRVVIQHAVREGARQGAIGRPESEIETVVINQSQDVLDATEIAICFVDGPDANTYPGNVGDNVRVSANYVYSFAAVSGQLLRPLGVDPDDFEIVMNPHGEARLERSVTGATSC
ncbi:MAG: TadE/TadG family type IV pilus assembly protein [Dehalococcoidia bacterium]|nr:TadE/TadG family type IV pilus assembly protein [Dehalococcoidia bacterium]